MIKENFDKLDGESFHGLLEAGEDFFMQDQMKKFGFEIILKYEEFDFGQISKQKTYEWYWNSESQELAVTNYGYGFHDHEQCSIIEGEYNTPRTITDIFNFMEFEVTVITEHDHCNCKVFNQKLLDEFIRVSGLD